MIVIGHTGHPSHPREAGIHQNIGDKTETAVGKMIKTVRRSTDIWVQAGD